LRGGEAQFSLALLLLHRAKTHLLLLPLHLTSLPISTIATEDNKEMHRSSRRRSSGSRNHNRTVVIICIRAGKGEEEEEEEEEEGLVTTAMLALLHPWVPRLSILPLFETEGEKQRGTRYGILPHQEEEQGEEEEGRRESREWVEEGRQDRRGRRAIRGGCLSSSG